MIELRGINKTYPNGFVALKNIDLSVEKGDIMGIIGYSGAGKSTLIRIINRLEEPSSGEIHIDGIDLLKFQGKGIAKRASKNRYDFSAF